MPQRESCCNNFDFSPVVEWDFPLFFLSSCCCCEGTVSLRLMDVLIFRAPKTLQPRLRLLGRSFRHKVHFLPLPPLPPPLWKLTGIAFVAWIVFNFGFYVYFYLCMCISHHSHLQLISSCLFLRTLDVSIDSIRRAIRNVIQLQAIAVASGGRWDEFRKKYK